METTEFPRYSPAFGRAVWACCVSTIGPVCEHRRFPDGSIEKPKEG